MVVGHRAWSPLVLAGALSLAAPRAQAQSGGEPLPLPPGAPSDVPPERMARVKVKPGAETDGRPFQMGLEYTQFLREEGGLAFPGQSARSLGLRFVFREGRSIRQHFAIAHQWERNGTTVRQGFRFDLLALGFPIRVWDGGDGAVLLEVEPILRPIRGQILFEGQGQGSTRSMLRFESGFAFGLRATKGAWFFSFEPLAVDFRTIVATRDSTSAGFSRIWSMAVTVGREF
jgi:hypothetical protein